MCKKSSYVEERTSLHFLRRTIANRLCQELNRLVNELALERDVLLDFQSKLDAAEYVLTFAKSIFIIISCTFSLG